jgi:transcriptional regulator with XRE-family HTH domain
MFDKNESLTAVAHIGQNIARFRGLRRMTQKEMADKLKIAQPVYSKIEQKAKVDDEILQRISDVLNIPAEVIKNFTEEAIINNINCHFADNAINTVYNVNPNEKLIY